VNLADLHDRAQLDRALAATFGLFTSLDFSSDGARIFVGAGCRVYAVDTATGQLRAQALLADPTETGFDPCHHELRVARVQDARDDSCCVSVFFDPSPGNRGTGLCHLFEPDLGQMIVPHGRDASFPVLAPDEIDTIASVYATAVAEVGHRIAVADLDSDVRGRIAIFHARTGELLHTHPGFQDGVWALDLDPVGHHLAVMEVAQIIDLYRVETGEQVAQVRIDGPGRVSSFRLGRADQLLVATIDPPQLLEIDLAASPPTVERRIDLPAGVRPQCLQRSGWSVWAPTEAIDLSFYGDDGRRVADATRELVLAHPRHGARAHPAVPTDRRRGPIAISPDGTVLASTVGHEVVIERIAASVSP